MSKGESSGCLKFFLICLFAFAVLIVIGGYYVYNKSGEWLKSGSAATVELFIEGIVDDLDYSHEEKMRIAAPAKELAERIRSGEVTPKQTTAVFTEFATGGGMAAIYLISFHKRHVKTADFLSDDEKAQAWIDFSRFIHASVERTLPVDALEKIASITEIEDQNIGSSIDNITPDLSEEDIRKTIAQSKQFADQAGIENREFKVDLERVIRDAIQRGLAVGEVPVTE